MTADEKKPADKAEKGSRARSRYRDRERERFR